MPFPSKDLIKFVYRINDRQIEDEPAWMGTDRFDIVAQPDGDGKPGPEQWRTMIRKLLVIEKADKTSVN